MIGKLGKLFQYVVFGKQNMNNSWFLVSKETVVLCCWKSKKKIDLKHCTGIAEVRVRIPVLFRPVFPELFRPLLLLLK